MNRIPSVLAGLSLLAACSGGLGSVPCRDDGECETGFYCGSDGKCAVAPACGGAAPTLCHATCTDTATDLANCGTCGTACVPPEQGTPSCSAGVCGFSCTAPYVKVGAACKKTPPTPTGVVATGGAGNVALRWDPSAGADSYLVNRATQPAGPFTQVGTPSSASYADTAVASGATYYYTVQAVNGAGASVTSAEVSAQTIPPAPSAPSATASNTAVSITLRWAAAPGASSYVIERATAPAGPFTELDTATAPPYVDASVLGGTTYYYQVMAENHSGRSPATSIVSALTLPAGPTLQPTTSGVNEISLSWNDVTGATGYVVSRSAVSGSGYAPIPSGSAVSCPGGTCSVLDTGLPGGATYYYVVTATNASGTSGYSNEQPGVTLPDAVTWPTAAAAGATPQITVSWNRVSGATSYDLYRSTSSNTETLLINVADPGAGATASYSDTAVANATRYYYKIVSRDAGGDSGLASAAETPAALTSPAAPASVSASALQQAVTLRWNSSATADHYLVYRGTSQGGESTTSIASINDTGTTGYQYADNGLSSGTTYYYVVAAANAGGTGPRGVEVSAVTVPAAPALPSASAAGTTVTFSFNAMSGATSYAVLRSTSSGAEQADASAACVLSGGRQQCTDSGLAADTTYFYQATATNAAGTSSKSAEVSVATVPGVVAGLRATTATDTSASIQWNPGATATSYTVARAPAGGGGTVQATDCSASTCTFTEAVSPGSQYQYTVTATNGAGSSAATPGLVVNTRPSQAAGVQIGSLSDTGLSLSWTAAPGAASYDVYRGGAAGSETFYKNVASPGLSLTESSLNANTRYAYQVYAKSAQSVLATVSNEALATTLLSPPTGFTVSIIDDQNVHTTWTAAPVATNYEIDRGPSSGAESSRSVLPPAAGAVQSFDDNVVTGNPYFYKVRALTATNHSPFSAEVSVTTVPSTAPSFTVAALDEKSVSLNLTRLPGFDVYDVYRSIAAGGTPVGNTSYSPLNQGGGTNIVQIDTGLSKGATYFFRVRARYTPLSLTTPWSAELAVTTSSFAPNQPTAITAAGGNTYVLLDWTAPAQDASHGAASSYDVYRATPGNSFPATPLLSNVANPYVTDTTASASGQYTYWVVAKNGLGTSATPSTAPAPPTLPTASVIVDGSAFTATRFVNYISDTSEILVPQAPNATIYMPQTGTGGLITSFTSPTSTKANPDGYFVATGLGAGPVYVKYKNTYVVTANRTIDLGVDQGGRPDATFSVANSPTNGVFNLTNLAPYATTDFLEWFSTNVNNEQFGIDQLASSGAPAPGATSINGMLVDLAYSGNSNYSIVDGSPLHNDKTFFSQLSSQTSTTGQVFASIQRTLTFPQSSTVDGRQTTFSGALTNPNTSTTSVAVKYLRSTFKAYQAQINPAAVNAADTLDIDTIPNCTASNAACMHHGPYTGGVDMVFANTNVGTSDIDFGTLTYATPYTSTWDTRGTVNSNFTVGIALPGLTPYQLTAGIAAVHDIASFDSLAPGGLRALVSPPQNPLVQWVDSAGVAHNASGFQDNLGLGTTTVTLSWSAPQIPVGGPDYYSVRIFKLVNDGAGNTALGGSTTFKTTGNSITTPPGTLAVGQTYFAYITANSEAGFNATAAPFKNRNINYAGAPVVLNKFSP